MACAGSFESYELSKVESSRWSNSRKMAVVDSTTDFDLELIVGGSGAVDFIKGLTPKEKKDRARLSGISFAQVTSKDFGAKQISSSLSTKTVTPGKVVPPSKGSSEEDTMARSIITYDTKTTAGKIDAKMIQV